LKGIDRDISAAEAKFNPSHLETIARNYAMHSQRWTSSSTPLRLSTFRNQKFNLLHELRIKLSNSTTP